MGIGILALDLGLTTGWCFGGGDKPPLSGSFRFGNLQSFGARGHAFRGWLEAKIEGLDPALLVFESPLTHMAGSNARRILPGLAWTVEEVAFGFNLRVKEQDPMSVKVHFTGSGKAKKPDMMRAATARGWTFPDDNAADAMALFDFALSREYPDDWRRTQLGRDLLATLPRTVRPSAAL